MALAKAWSAGCLGPFHRDRGCYHTVSHWMKKIGLKWHLQPKGGGKGEWKENYPEKMTDARVCVGGGSGGCGGRVLVKSTRQDSC